MRYSIIILFILLSGLQVSSQNTLAILSSQLTASCKNDREKVSAIFRWITENISYKITPRNRTRIMGKSSHLFSKYEDGITEDTGALKPLNERVAIEVLKRKEAVCDGYARLFSTLCSYTGIQSEIIVGYARSNENKPGLKFGVNHYWNAVYFEGGWHLLDAT
ncbi:MAG: transglutaminase domain-containing protein, partial [Chitinophagaceae bacterium]